MRTICCFLVLLAASAQAQTLEQVPDAGQGECWAYAFSQVIDPAGLVSGDSDQTQPAKGTVYQLNPDDSITKEVSIGPFSFGANQSAQTDSVISSIGITETASIAYSALDHRVFSNVANGFSESVGRWDTICYNAVRVKNGDPAKNYRVNTAAFVKIQLDQNKYLLPDADFSLNIYLNEFNFVNYIWVNNIGVIARTGKRQLLDGSVIDIHGVYFIDANTGDRIIMESMPFYPRIGGGEEVDLNITIKGTNGNSTESEIKCDNDTWEQFLSIESYLDAWSVTEL